MRRMDGMLEVEGERREKMGVVLIAGDLSAVSLWNYEVQRSQKRRKSVLQSRESRRQ